MKDSLLASLALLLLFVALPVFLLWIRDRIREHRHRKAPEQIQTEAGAYRERLLHPDPGGVEARIGGLLPERLIILYKDEATILNGKVEIRSPRLGPKEFGEWIEAFLPLDAESQLYTCELKEWGNGFCFAADGMGNFYWVPVSANRQSDAPVFFACHDPWGNAKIAESLDEFLSWPRVAHPYRR